MKILFLHGWTSVPGGLKPTFLKEHGYEVLNPALPDDDFDEAVRIAQAEYDQHQPDVIVGSSRGGAVAVNIESGDTPLVLLCPAWKNWGEATTVRYNTVIRYVRILRPLIATLLRGLQRESPRGLTSSDAAGAANSREMSQAIDRTNTVSTPDS